MKSILTPTLTSFMVVMVILQWFFGNFPTAFTAFPLNIAIAALWVAALTIAHREMKDRPLVRTLGSGKCSVAAIALFLAGSLITGLTPQAVDPMATDALTRLGLHAFTTSWIFVGIVFLLMTNLTLVILRKGLNKKHHKLRFQLNHVGLWLVLLSAFFGAADTQKVRLMAVKDQPTQQAYNQEGQVSVIDQPITYKTFKAEFFSNGMPSSYRANVLIGKQPVTLEVNKPYAKRWDEDIYLTSYDMANPADARYCIIEVVKQPWRYVTLAGILLMAAAAVLMFIFGADKKEKKHDNVG